MSKSALVIGAGVVGLAVSRGLAREGYDVLIAERERAAGTQTSARNSGVIHAGIYYPKNSLKAWACLRGKHLLYSYCSDKAVPHANVQKLIVATQPDQHAALQSLFEQAQDNGVPIERLGPQSAKEIEPELHATAALLSSTTGIVDAAALVQTLTQDIHEFGCDIAYETDIHSLVPQIDSTVVEGTSAGEEFTANFDIVINAAGHGAYGLTQAYWPAAPKPPARFAKGNYFSIVGRAPFERLIYPLPEPGGLGIHFTRDMDRRGLLGPNVEWVAQADYSVSPKLEPLFRQAVSRYWPNVADRTLIPDYAGLRPKVDGDDFVIGVHGRIVTLLGIESPGLTASFALAEKVVEHVVRL